MAIFRKFAGSGYIVLNVLRTLNIIVLTMAAVAAVLMMIKTFVVSKVIPSANSPFPNGAYQLTPPTKFFIFDAVSHLITTLITLFLILSEIPLPFVRNYFARNWPLLSTSSGLTALGLAIIGVGISLLGSLNNAANSEDSLGTPFWRIVTSAGILCCFIGLFDIILSYVYRNKEDGITARMLRAHGATDAKVRVTAEKNYRYPSSTNSPHLSRGTTVRDHRRAEPPAVAETRASRFMKRFSRHQADGGEVSPVSPMSVPSMPHPAYQRDEEAHRTEHTPSRPYSPTSVYGGYGNPYR